jgi:hypothetical protein
MRVVQPSVVKQRRPPDSRKARPMLCRCYAPQANIDLTLLPRLYSKQRPAAHARGVHARHPPLGAVSAPMTVSHGSLHLRIRWFLNTFRSTGPHDHAQQTHDERDVQAIVDPSAAYAPIEADTRMPP